MQLVLDDRCKRYWRQLLRWKSCKFWVWCLSFREVEGAIQKNNVVLGSIRFSSGLYGFTRWQVSFVLDCGVLAYSSKLSSNEDFRTSKNFAVTMNAPIRESVHSNSHNPWCSCAWLSCVFGLWAYYGVLSTKQVGLWFSWANMLSPCPWAKIEGMEVPKRQRKRICSTGGDEGVQKLVSEQTLGPGFE